MGRPSECDKSKTLRAPREGRGGGAEMVDEYALTLSAWGRALEALVERDAHAAMAAASDHLHLLHTLAGAGVYAVPVDESLGVPADLHLASADAVSATRAVLTFAWAAVPGATAYDICHEFGSPYVPGMRLIATVAATEATVGTSPPFTVAPGHPYTVAVYARSAKGRAPVPAVLEVQAPEYVPPAVATPGGRPPIATIRGQIVADSLQVPIVVGAPGIDLSTVSPTTFIVDTGAFEVALDTATAAALHLPNDGPLAVSGVGGSTEGYQTHIDVQLGPGGPVYRGVNAVVVPNFGSNLWGLRFAVDRGLALTLDTRAATLTYTEG